MGKQGLADILVLEELVRSLALFRMCHWRCLSFG
jgi:hypothetical protein